MLVWLQGKKLPLWVKNEVNPYLPINDNLWTKNQIRLPSSPAGGSII
jgi:hypothetical protein